MRIAPLLCVLLIAASLDIRGERLTQKCNTLSVNGAAVFSDPALATRMQSAVRNPSSDPDMYERLWEPKQFGGPFDGYRGQDTLSRVLFDKDPVQDLAEILGEMAQDPVLAASGLHSVEFDTSYVCNLQQYVVDSLTEYHNVTLDHYFLSSSSQENAFIDAGGAGPGWVRTGVTFRAPRWDGCNSSAPVHRFYGPSARSHVFTADPLECGGLRKSGTGWLREGVAFGSWPLSNDGSCGASRTSVWRFYNNRAVQGDPNHRFVAQPSVMLEMFSRGWVLEGLAFCLEGVNPP